MTSGVCVPGASCRAARPARFVPFVWANRFENAPGPTSATKTATRQRADASKERRLKKADFEVDFLFIRWSLGYRTTTNEHAPCEPQLSRRPRNRKYAKSKNEDETISVYRWLSRVTTFLPECPEMCQYDFSIFHHECFHFPSVRAHILWFFVERDSADPCASCDRGLNLHHNFAAQFLRCGDSLGWI